MEESFTVAWLPRYSCSSRMNSASSLQHIHHLIFLRAAEEKIDPIDFAFHETTNGELVGCMSPRPKPPEARGILNVGFCPNRTKTGLSSHNSTQATRPLFKTSRPGGDRMPLTVSAGRAVMHLRAGHT